MRLPLLALLAAAALLNPFTSAGQEPGCNAFLGLQLGMTQAQVEPVLAAMTDVASVDRKKRKDAVASGSPRTIRVRFTDDRFFAVDFSRSGADDAVVQLHLVYQGKSYTPQIFAAVLQQCGKPEYERASEMVDLFAWGGTGIDEGAVIPAPGSKATLLVEHLKGQHVDLQLNQVK